MRVFISYAREDTAAANRLYGDLSKIDGVSPWLDSQDLLPGMTWQEEIETAIGQSEYVVVLLSKQSVGKTGYYQKEMRRALELLDRRPPREVFVIPARLDECKPEHSRLRQLQWVDLFPAWERGVEAIAKVLLDTPTIGPSEKEKSPLGMLVAKIEADLPTEVARAYNDALPGQQFEVISLYQAFFFGVNEDSGRVAEVMRVPMAGFAVGILTGKEGKVANAALTLISDVVEPRHQKLIGELLKQASDLGRPRLQAELRLPDLKFKRWGTGRLAELFYPAWNRHPDLSARFSADPRALESLGELAQYRNFLAHGWGGRSFADIVAFARGCFVCSLEVLRWIDDSIQALPKTQQTEAEQGR